MVPLSLLPAYKSFITPVLFVSFSLLLTLYMVRTVAGIIQALCQCIIYLPVAAIVIKLCHTKITTIQLFYRRVHALYKSHVIEQSLATIAKFISGFLQALTILNDTDISDNKSEAKSSESTQPVKDYETLRL
ncbi:hypothetical protein GGI42DRAFT_337359 [Trichoderma sp. SZMC 28013]